MAAPIDYGVTGRAIADRLTGYRSRVDTTIAPDDAMFQGDLDDYLSVSYSAVAQIAHAMAISGRTSFARILDFASGHGRVLRALKAAFPEAELTACDVNRDGVDFCAAQFGAVPAYSETDPSRVSLDGSFDLIWVGSLLTHLDAQTCRGFLQLFREHLEGGGLLLFSTHGRNAVNRWPADGDRQDAIVADVARCGFGYRDHEGVEGFGTSAFTAAWIADVVLSWSDLMLIGYVERGLADHQDVVALLKTDVHHRQGDLLVF